MFPECSLEQDLVAVDLKKYDEFPDWISSHGPFLRLADRSGWLFERKDCKRVLFEVPTKRGLWAMRVASETGLLLRRHPSHRYDLVVQPEKSFPHHLVVCASNQHVQATVQSFRASVFNYGCPSDNRKRNNREIKRYCDVPHG
jgi:hypothetical protein